MDSQIIIYMYMYIDIVVKVTINSGLTMKIVYNKKGLLQACLAVFSFDVVQKMQQTSLIFDK